MDPIFTYPPEKYARNIDIVGGYVSTMSDYLSRRFNDPIEKTREFVVQNIKPDGLFPIQDPMIAYLGREKKGNRQLYDGTVKDDPNFDYSRHDYTFLKYMNRIISPDNLNSALIFAPTLTVTLSPKFKKSLLAEYIGVNLKLRKTYKHKMLQCDIVSDIDGEIFFNILQTTCKIKNNSLSGAHSSPSTVLFNKSSHSILTSTCRCATSYGNANNEKFLMGNRHYWCADVVLSNIFTIIQNTDMVALQLAMDTYNLKYPETHHVMDAIIYSSAPYWTNDVHITRIEQIVTTLTPLQKAAFLFVGDMYHLSSLNEEFVITMLREYIEVIEVQDFPNPKEVFEGLDEFTSSFAKAICFHIVSGKKIGDIEKNDWPAYCTLAATSQHILDVSEKYRRLFQGMFRPSTLAPSISKIPSIVRRAVVTSDTDSSIFTNAYWVSKVCGGIKFDAEAFRVGNTTTYLTAQMVKHTLALLSANLGIIPEQVHKLSMKNEFYFNIFTLTPSAKHYYAYVNSREGGVYATPKLEIKGVELRSSNAPDHVMQMVKDYCCYIFDSITIGAGNLTLKEILKPIYDLEMDILNDIENGGYRYLRKMQIKDAESYINAEDSSAYKQHLFWQEVFAPKYGYVEDPPYPAIKISVNTKSKKAFLAWIHGIEDVELSTRLVNWANNNLKTSLTTVWLPEPIISAYGIPTEILRIADSRKLIMGIVAPFYLILESLGLHLRNKNMTRMVHDFYSDTMSPGEDFHPFRELA